MNKIELLTLVENLKDEDDVIETLKTIEGLANSSIDINKLSIEDFKKVITDNKEIKGYYTSEKDRTTSKAIDTWKSKHLQDEIDKAIKAKSDEGLTEEQKQLKELLKYKEDMESEKKINTLKNSYKDIFKEKKLDESLMDYIDFTKDKEFIDSNIDKLNKIITDSINAGVKERMGGKDETPPKDDNKNLSLEQQIAQAMGVK